MSGDGSAGRGGTAGTGAAAGGGAPGSGRGGLGSPSGAGRLAGACNADHSTAPAGAVAAVVVATALFGTVGTARVLGPEASSWSVGAVRLALGAAALVLAARCMGTPMAALRSLARLSATWCAAAGMAAFQVTFLTAVEVTGVAVGTLLAIGSAPLFTGLLTRHVTGPWLAATGVALAGLVLLVLGGSEAGRLDGYGAVLSLAAGLSYAVYTVGSKAQVAAGHPPAATAAASFTVAAMLLAPALAATDLSWLASPAGVAMAAYLALGPTATSYVLFAIGLRALPASTVSTLGLTEPVVAAFLGVAVLGERLTPAGTIGAGLVLAGLVILARAAARSGAAASTTGPPVRTEQSRA